MAKTLRKRKIAKAYGLKYLVKNIKGTKIRAHVIKRHISNCLIDVIFFKAPNNIPSYRIELAFYKYIEDLRPKTFKSRIGGNY